MTELTLEKLQAAFDLVCPPLYYICVCWIPLGQVFHVKESGVWPEYIVCNGLDLELIRKLVVGRRLVDAKQWKPDYTKLIKEIPYGAQT